MPAQHRPGALSCVVSFGRPKWDQLFSKAPNVLSVLALNSPDMHFCIGEELLPRVPGQKSGLWGEPPQQKVPRCQGGEDRARAARRR